MRIVYYILSIVVLISCQSNTQKNVFIEQKDSISLDNKIENIKLVETEGVIVESYNSKNDKHSHIAKKCVDIYNCKLQYIKDIRSYFLSVEILNNTNDTIFLSNDMFFYKENSDWKYLHYPENFSKDDIGLFIIPYEHQCRNFFFPLNENHIQGGYKLQLSFYTNSENMYYVAKIFALKYEL